MVSSSPASSKPPAVADGAWARRIAGALLIAASAATVLAMAHHPTGGHAPGNQAVHAGMIILLSVVFFGLCVLALARRLGLLMLAGVVAYAISLFGHLGAASISGFITPLVAERVTPSDHHEIFVLLWAGNRSLAALGFYATSAAFVFLGLGMLRDGWLWRLTGLAGILAGLVPALLLWSGVLTLDVRGALVLYSSHAVFTALAGVCLLSGRPAGK